ncbi:hypothetical protein ACBJ59_57920 [Nonomuraea sp. MTCD27]|uniref:hypothetical protein n=1 Tax=Nonomuraea sp. MTCD27 TaxID=1676747 RepID=UPI0035C1BFA5
MPEPRERIPQDVPDITDVEQLIRYATSAQLARLETHGIANRVAARAAKIAPGNLSSALGGSKTSQLTETRLRNLDAAIVALAPAPRRDHAGALSMLGIRLRGTHSRPAHSGVA